MENPQRPTETLSIQDIASVLDDLLTPDQVPDFSGAWNGIQVETSRRIGRVALAVDASLAAIEAAIRGGADMMIVHHGLFWDPVRTLTGARYRKLKALIEADIGIYASHLPLDVHPSVGNNAQLAEALGIEIQGTFGEYKGYPLGQWGMLEIRREALAARLDELLGGRVMLVPGGPERLKRVGVITGGAASEIHSAIEAGLDAFVTGEGAHHNYFDAQEGGINLYLGGHYATETWGVKALGRFLEDRLGMETFFVNQPTGL